MRETVVKPENERFRRAKLEEKHRHIRWKEEQDLAEKQEEKENIIMMNRH